MAVDLQEPGRIAESVRLMNLKHCVITSVDRDDLKDGGSIIWAETIKAIRRVSPQTKFETLIPDFQGDWKNLQQIIDVHPDKLVLKNFIFRIFGFRHNVTKLHIRHSFCEQLF